MRETNNSGNDLLRKGLVVPFLLGIVIFLYPLFPEVEYVVNATFAKDEFDPTSYEQAFLNQDDLVDNLFEGEVLGTIDKVSSSKTKANVANSTIYFPSIGTKAKLKSGLSETILDSGAWLKASGGIPGTAKNIIVTGHRFRFYNGQRTFYHLPKVAEGDKIFVTWQGRIYKYQVTRNFIVNEKESWIEDSSSKERLTIYTCEGLDSTSRRVIFAEPVTI